MKLKEKSRLIKNHHIYTHTHTHTHLPLTWQAHTRTEREVATERVSEVDAWGVRDDAVTTAKRKAGERGPQTLYEPMVTASAAHKPSFALLK